MTLTLALSGAQETVITAAVIPAIVASGTTLLVFWLQRRHNERSEHRQDRRQMYFRHFQELKSLREDLWKMDREWDRRWPDEPPQTSTNIFNSAEKLAATARVLESDVTAIRFFGGGKVRELSEGVAEGLQELVRALRDLSAEVAFSEEYYDRESREARKVADLREGFAKLVDELESAMRKEIGSNV